MSTPLDPATLDTPHDGHQHFGHCADPECLRITAKIVDAMPLTVELSPAEIRAYIARQIAASRTEHARERVPDPYAMGQRAAWNQLLCDLLEQPYTL